MSLFVEQQNGGLCRMHALNAFFGYAKINSNLFDKYCNEFDKENKKYNLTTSCKEFDLINSNQSNIISYILKRHGIWTQYFALNQLYNKSIELPNHLVNKFIFPSFAAIRKSILLILSMAIII